MPRLAIQVIAYKSSADLPLLLESLKAQTFKDWVLYVYENSTDRVEAGRVQASLEAGGLPHHLFISPVNTGFAGGHQALYLMHDAPFVMLLNDDAKLDPGYLEAAMQRIESDKNIASVTGLVYRWTDDEEKKIDTAGLEYVCLAKIVDRLAGRPVREVSGQIAQAKEVFGVSGAVGLYRRSAIGAAGGLFDPAWFMYKEDVDLALRLKHAGYTAWFEPKAVAWHKRELREEGSGLWARIASEKARPAMLRRYSYVNQWRLYRRHWKEIAWRDRFQSVGIEAARSLLVFIASPSVFFSAWKDVIRGV